MEYTVLVHPAEEGGYWVEVPALPGCFSQGETVEETLNNVKDAIAAHITALRDDGKDVSGDNGLLVTKVRIAA